MTRFTIPLASALFVVGCGGDGGGIALGALQGSYDITESLDDESTLYDTDTPTCLLHVSGSHVTADCSKSSDTEKETLKVDARVTEEKITGELVYEKHLEPDAVCYESIAEIATVILSASKKSGSMVDGVFAPIAGTWDGSLTVELSYDQKLVENAPEYCTDEPELYAFTFSAVVAGNSAQIDWSGDGEEGELEVVGTENAISVNGSVVSK